LGARFTELTLEMVLAAPFIDGAEATLEALMDAGVPAVVCSGTPQDELERIVEARNLGGYFVEVHGSPRKKPEIVADVCARHNLNPADCLFIGDALTDMKAARIAGMPFLGVDGEDSADFPEGTSVVETLSLDALREAASKTGPQAKGEQ
jgi:HAD superfamily hydrolase (TIGR01509 family)